MGFQGDLFANDRAEGPPLPEGMALWTGFVTPGFPGMGAWISYGLGSLNDNLPAFVVLPDSRGFAPNGPANWGSGFLPAAHQGTMVRPGDKNPIADLFAPAEAKESNSHADE